jgi:probable rRNA maturation factor
MPVRLQIEDGPYEGISGVEVLRRARKMFRHLQLGKSELSIVLTSDDQIQKLNRLYRRKNRPTDVLAFAMREGRFAALPGDLLGDVVVSIPRARAQADERSVEPMAEVTMLVAHGILHLLGWDHDTPAKDRRMRAETDRLCVAAGSGPASAPFALARGRKRAR